VEFGTEFSLLSVTSCTNTHLGDIIKISRNRKQFKQHVDHEERYMTYGIKAKSSNEI
jgi:hypothetical protein